MTTLLRTLTALVAVAVVVVACGPSTAPTGASSPSPSVGASAAVAPDDLRYTCGAFTFAPGLVTGPLGDAEQADNPAAAALRAHLQVAAPENDLPDSGWYLTGMDGRVAEYVAPGRTSGLVQVTVENGAAGWTVSGWGECRPRVELAVGLGAADWAFDPAKPKPDATTQVFDVLVTEMSCNSGEPADGRIVGPEIVKSADTVLVVFAVRPRPGGHDCPSNPPTRVTVDLGEPLGDRKLLDGGTWPPGDPTEPAF